MPNDHIILLRALTTSNSSSQQIIPTPFSMLSLHSISSSNRLRPKYGPLFRLFRMHKPPPIQFSQLTSLLAVHGHSILDSNSPEIFRNSQLRFSQIQCLVSAIFMLNPSILITQLWPVDQASSLRKSSAGCFDCLNLAKASPQLVFCIPTFCHVLTSCHIKLQWLIPSELSCIRPWIVLKTL